MLNRVFLIFQKYPNRDSTPFIEFYGIPEAETCIRGTLRYQGFPEVIAALVEMGFLNDEENELVKKGAEPKSWVEVMSKAIGAKEATESSIVSTLQTFKAFQPASLGSLLISKLRKLGLFSDKKVTPRGNLLDTLCATLEDECQYGKGERDLVMLQHKFTIEKKDGTIVRLFCFLFVDVRFELIPPSVFRKPSLLLLRFTESRRGLLPWLSLWVCRVESPFSSCWMARSAELV